MYLKHVEPLVRAEFDRRGLSVEEFARRAILPVSSLERILAGGEFSGESVFLGNPTCDFNIAIDVAADDQGLEDPEPCTGMEMVEDRFRESVLANWASEAQAHWAGLL